MPNAAAPGTTLAIRTCKADGTSHGGYKWNNAIGAVNEAPDWNPGAACGNGLHALLDGWGDWSLLSSDADAVWQIVEVGRAACVDIGDKVKFPRCTVRYAGNMAGAMTMISDHQVRVLIAATKDKSDSGDSARIGSSGYSARIGSSGDYAQIGSSGDYARIGSSGNYARIGSSGNFAQIGSSGNFAQIGSSGNSARIGSSGNFAQIGSSGYSARIGSSGDYARIGSSGYSAKIAASGKDAIIASVGFHSTASAGEGGCFCLTWHDGKRPRMTVGYVGEDGIEPNVAYRCNDAGKLVRA